MRILMPLALAASAVVAFNQQHPIAPGYALSSRRRLQDWNRRLQEGKYEERYRKRCGAVGAFCGKVAGAVGATAVAMIPRRTSNGLSYGQRVKTKVRNGAWAGEFFAGHAAAYLGGEVGKMKDKILAKKAAKGRR
ncbi:hypothetical protein LEN26_002265 [Aphanomyces euteiches]|nr:hypothetical protein AeMF1_014129 [Aphanomyces euteiches]KAH9159592.1 hypothetical protein LEN26_002265 [Aphanomyces euteiches]KAH9180918.1 hypothetical protein AeNC1_017105 [Aphanomyces euteiches]